MDGAHHVDDRRPTDRLAQFNAQFRDNLLNLRDFAACAETGISGTASADTVLFGELPVGFYFQTTTVVALDMDQSSTTTTASAFETARPNRIRYRYLAGQTVSVGLYAGSFGRRWVVQGSSSCEL